MSFFNNFISNQTEFNRNLDMKEDWVFVSFKQADRNSVKYLGLGAVRPSAENCQKYHCLPSKTILYKVDDPSYSKIIEVSETDIKAMQKIWDKCHTKHYYCKHQSPFGATFNCIGWSLGITKWLNPQ